MSTAGVAPSSHPRIQSVDILRGLTMMVMIFVNDLGGVRGLPWWTYHVPAEVDAMTYVDVVFPAFLFIVGMAIPLAVRRRLERDPRVIRLWAHVLSRSLSLVLLGLMLANSSKVDPSLTGLSGGAWTALALVGAILIWAIYPAKAWVRIPKAIGVLAVIFVLAIFRRRTADGQPAWLDFSYWEILGLIGKTYLAVCILYIPSRMKSWAPALWLVALCGMNVVTAVGGLSWLRYFPDYVWPFDSGALGSIAMAGVVLSTMFVGPKAATLPDRTKIARGAAYAAVLAAAGRLLTPLGISKMRGTPTWCLYSAAITTVLFLVIYEVADVKRATRWAAFLRPAGSNTLLTYLVPDIFYSLSPYGFLKETPAIGVVRSVAFTFLILGCSAVLTRMKVRMQL